MAKTKSTPPEPTGEEREKVGPGHPPKAFQFQAGNPGRPKGSRNKLGEAFIEALHDDFSEGGIDAIKKVRLEDPSAYMRVIASLLPKELKIETKADLTDEQLDQRIKQLASLFGLEVGVPGTAAGAPTAQGSKSVN